MSTIWAVIVAAGVPSALFGLLIRGLSLRLDKRAKVNETMEEARAKNQTLIIKAVMASLTLGEATAEAVQRIPYAHCNGDMHGALEEAKKVKEDYRAFEHEQTIKSLA